MSTPEIVFVLGCRCRYLEDGSMIYMVTKKREIAENWERNNVRLPILREISVNPLSSRLREYADVKLADCEIFAGYDYFYYTEIVCEGKPRWMHGHLVWEVESPT